MPNMDLIHARQKMEGCEACFGRAESACHRNHCKWHAECQALASFKPIRGLGHRPTRRPPPGILTRATFGGFRTGGTQTEHQEGAVETRNGTSSPKPRDEAPVAMTASGHSQTL
jgi:hypothetical protein